MEKNFLSFGIDNKLVKILKQNGINTPTPIQEQTIPEVLKGKDVIAQAQTGTGKTIAFILPMIQKINAEKDAVQGLIITPTRELAIQITEEAKKLAPGKGVNILAAYGGQDVERQIRKLKGNVHLVIGTPGRLLDHLRRKTINFGNLEMLVLDEADQMLHMGFLNEVEEIIDQTKKKRQTMFFSATMPKQIKSLVSRYMKDPLQIKIESQNITLNEIKQIVIETTDRGKQDALCKVMDESNPFLGLIFCRTKRRVSALNDDLGTRGYNCAELHGDMSQAKREKVMKDFKSAKLQYLIATDIAARGIDVEGITHVFNYDIAQDTESYIHRIGRTGRAGQTGIAYTFVAEKDREALSSIERGIRLTLKKEKSVNSNNGEKKKPKFESKDDFEKKKDYGKKDFKSNKKSGFSNKKSSGKFGDSKGKKPSKGNRI